MSVLDDGRYQAFFDRLRQWFFKGDNFPRNFSMLEKLHFLVKLRFCF